MLGVLPRRQEDEGGFETHPHSSMRYTRSWVPGTQVAGRVHIVKPGQMCHRWLTRQGDAGAGRIMNEGLRSTREGVTTWDGGEDNVTEEDMFNMRPGEEGGSRHGRCQ